MRGAEIRAPHYLYQTGELFSFRQENSRTVANLPPVLLFSCSPV